MPSRMIFFCLCSLANKQDVEGAMDEMDIVELLQVEFDCTLSFDRGSYLLLPVRNEHYQYN